ncbi:methionine--tRNA ligase [Candidatus Gottesmanbacteria bacterium]|nr:methionine--tRNA ligase [Candidatus Gottesmanbacteria bacterium]
MNKFYITAAIPYVNGAPHIGHALEFVQCDVIARFKKLIGFKTLLISGSDENGLKIVQAAEKQGLSPQELADKNTKVFLDFTKLLNVEIDVWRRGSDKKLHWPGSQKLWELCKKSGDIYEKNWGGYYCVGCEDFYTKKDLIDGKCPEHLTPPEWVEEKNYFFKLSKYENIIRKLIESDELLITPRIRKNEVLAFIKKGLSDFSASRSKSRAKNWGIPVPGDSSQVIYTWFDALNVYQTAVGFGYDESLWKKWWPADVHEIGKGILRFHAVYWIGMLLSAKLPLPKSIFAHGYISSGGQKMSKSLGNVIDPFDVVKKYGVDATRYYLLREIPAHGDGDFTYKRFEELYNADLANGLGNLIARVARLCETDGMKGINDYSKDLDNLKSSLNQGGYEEHLERYEFNLALEELWREIKTLDQKMEEDKPWSKSKNEREGYLKSYIKRLLSIAYLLQIFLPDSAEKILNQFSNATIKSQAPLFPRIK